MTEINATKGNRERQNRVVIVTDAPFTKRDFVRVGVNTFRAHSLTVRVFGVWKLTIPELVREQNESFDEVPVTVIETEDQLASLEACLRTSRFAIMLTGMNGITGDNRQVYRAISRSGVTMIALLSNFVPGLDRFKGDIKQVHRRLMDIVKRLFQGQIDFRKSIEARIPRSLQGIRPIDYVIYGGSRSRALRHPVEGPGTREIAAHAMDYDRFLEQKAHPEPLNDSVVFVDQFLPYHPDFPAMGIKSPVLPEDYFRDINRLFDAVEAQTGLQVVIAVHPRADYTDKTGIFGGRPLIYDNTAAVIAQSRLVILHDSTACALPVLFQKPILQVATQGMLAHGATRAKVLGIAEVLGQRPLLMDDREALESFDFRALLNGISIASYRRYVENFIKQPESPEAPMWEIVLAQLSADGIV